MKHNVRVNSLLKGLNVSLEDFTVVTNGDCIYNPKLMTTQELVEFRESLLKDIEEKEICRLYKLLDEAKCEVRRIDEAIMDIELRHHHQESDFEASEDWEEMTYDEKGPWSPNWYKDERTPSEALEDLKRKMEAKDDDDDQDLSGTFPLTRL